LIIDFLLKIMYYQLLGYTSTHILFIGGRDIDNNDRKRKSIEYGYACGRD